MYLIELATKAKKDFETVERSDCKEKTQKIFKTVRKNPYEKSQGFEELKGKYKGICTRRINKQNRFVYVVLPNVDDLKDNNGNLYNGIVRVLRLWGHFP